jgi:hypothetical protein
MRLPILAVSIVSVIAIAIVVKVVILPPATITTAPITVAPTPPAPIVDSVAFLIAHPDVLSTYETACKADKTSYGGATVNGYSLQCANVEDADAQIAGNNALTPAKSTGPAVANPFSDIPSAGSKNP